MAITYPLALPTSIGIGSVDIRAVNAVTTSQSPFTYKQQVVSHTGQRWEASVSLPPLRKEFIEPWVAFLVSLKGQAGTFLLGDPNNVTPRGVATEYFSVVSGQLLLESGSAILLEDGDTMLFERGAITSLQVDGGGQTGGSVNLKGGPANVTDYFRAGDYLQFGSASSATLHKILSNVDTNSFGDMNVDIWPDLRYAPNDGASVQFTNTVGRFRLAANQQSWSINKSSAYGLTFDCIEAI